MGTRKYQEKWLFQRIGDVQGIAAAAGAGQAVQDAILDPGQHVLATRRTGVLGDQGAGHAVHRDGGRGSAAARDRDDQGGGPVHVAGVSGGVGGAHAQYLQVGLADGLHVQSGRGRDGRAGHLHQGGAGRSGGRLLKVGVLLEAGQGAAVAELGHRAAVDLHADGGAIQEIGNLDIRVANLGQQGLKLVAVYFIVGLGAGLVGQMCRLHVGGQAHLEAGKLAGCLSVGHILGRTAVGHF